jgi:hypothetical protein
MMKVNSFDFFIRFVPFVPFVPFCGYLFSLRRILPSPQSF